MPWVTPLFWEPWHASFWWKPFFCEVSFQARHPPTQIFLISPKFPSLIILSCLTKSSPTASTWGRPWRRRRGRWTSPCTLNWSFQPSRRTACWCGTRLHARRSTNDRWRISFLQSDKPLTFLSCPRSVSQSAGFSPPYRFNCLLSFFLSLPVHNLRLTLDGRSQLRLKRHHLLAKRPYRFALK